MMALLSPFQILINASLKFGVSFAYQSLLIVVHVEPSSCNIWSEHVGEMMMHLALIIEVLNHSAILIV
jgi:hypothetical protein